MRASTTLKRSRLGSQPVDAADEALKTALRFLGRQARSEAEISAHLTNRGYSAALALQILAKLRASHYAGDQSFAREWARSRAEGRGYGPLKIEQELRAKGIDESLIPAALRETFAGNYEVQKAREIVRKQFRRADLKDPRSLRRAAAFLQRRGYNETVIIDVLGRRED